VWFTSPADTAGPGNVINPAYWYAPSQVTFAINGLIYLDSANGSYLLTNLLRRRQPPVNTLTQLAAPVVAPGPYLVNPQASTWLEIDLSQPATLGDSQEVQLMHGVPVMNSVMNLTGVMPTNSAQWVAHVEYVLNCSWMASRGSAEFVF
jgi:hypothetical protein